MDDSKLSPARDSALGHCQDQYAGDLAAKVRSVVTDDDGYGKALEHPMSGESDHEATIFAWGYVFGVAYGIARGEDPYQPITVAAERAYEAAAPVHRRLVGEADA